MSDGRQDVAARVQEMLGTRITEGSEAWECAVESIEYVDEADELFDAAESMLEGDERTEVLQRAHDAMRSAGSWEQEAMSAVPDSGPARATATAGSTPHTAARDGGAAPPEQ